MPFFYQFDYYWTLTKRKRKLYRINIATIDHFETKILYHKNYHILVVYVNTRQLSISSSLMPPVLSNMLKAFVPAVLSQLCGIGFKSDYIIFGLA